MQGRKNRAGGPLIRVLKLQYNIHHGEGMDGKVDLIRLANVIKSVSPDLGSCKRSIAESRVRERSISFMNWRI